MLENRLEHTWYQEYFPILGMFLPAFPVTFLFDDDYASVIFTVVQEKRKRLDGIPAADDNNVVDLIDDDDASSEKSTQPPKKSRSKTTTNARCK